jgi:hypothetical protein
MTDENYKEMIGEDWKCYDSLRHFELSQVKEISQNVMIQIAKNLGKMKQLRVLKVMDL